jgi:hypothetical protein
VARARQWARRRIERYLPLIIGVLLAALLLFASAWTHAALISGRAT